MAKQLEQGVLKGVSRSFYLSLRFLPKGFRRPASLGYLLARISDTVADSEDVPVAERERLLEDFQACVANASASLPSLAIFPSKVATAKEQILLKNGDRCLATVGELPAWQQRAVRKVVETITDGQLWDLRRFGTNPDKVVELANAAELKNYTYQVAGCVGEFWTELAIGLNRFPSDLEAAMVLKGRHYGQALQLINILRDTERDRRLGRCYLPGGDTEAERRRWTEQARDWLEEGEWYCQRLRGKRLRFSSWLPLLIGRCTLDLLSQKNDGSPQKITRRELKREMRRALKLALKKPIPS